MSDRVTWRSKEPSAGRIGGVPPNATTPLVELCSHESTELDIFRGRCFCRTYKESQRGELALDMYLVQRKQMANCIHTGQ